MTPLLLIVWFHFTWGQALDLPQEVRQLLVVSVNYPHQNQALLYSYERDAYPQNGLWRTVFDPISVTLGDKGLALGLGVHHPKFDQTHKLALKMEGDGRSPAGIFRLSRIFGYDAQSPNPKMEYIPLTKDIHCVDDSQSPFYNQILAKTSGYKSFEKMRREDGLYRWGIVVEHNPQALKARGSCIFIHIMKESGQTTAGCTAMRQGEILKIIKWLDKSKGPVLLQYLRR